MSEDNTPEPGQKLGQDFFYVLFRGHENVRDELDLDKILNDEFSKMIQSCGPFSKELMLAACVRSETISAALLEPSQRESLNELAGIMVDKYQSIRSNKIIHLREMERIYERINETDHSS